MSASRGVQWNGCQYDKCVCTVGLLDYEAALKLAPANETLRADAQRIRDVVQSSSGDTQ